MKKHVNGQIQYLTFDSLDNLTGITNLFTTRFGGVSTGYHASMNLGFSNGDNPESVTKNYEIIAKCIGVNVDHIVRTHQTHTTNVLTVTEENVFNDGKLHTPEYTDVDGLITDVPGICLATFYADCVPLYFVDPVKKVIGLSHSGWRGTVGKMGKVTVQKMVNEYNCNPENIFAAIGPSICQNCYEISKDVADEFINTFGTDKYLQPGKSSDKYQLDLWLANRDIMLEAGITEGHIELPGICTCCNPDFLFSHRASGGKRGNLAAFLMLNP